MVRPSKKAKTMVNDLLCINTIRTFCADVVQKAKSGHPGAPMGMAPIAHILWGKILKYSPSNPKWYQRDRFVLSNGHACALLYSMLHLTGYEEFTLDELKRFRQVGSKTPGHPENHIVKGGVEVTTGPLGQGFANAVGLAIGEAHLAANFNKPGFPIFDNYTYVFCGDGCLQEGVCAEAASVAGHLGLGKLIVIYDDNKVTIDGETSLSFSEDVPKRFQGYGWHTLVVEKGDEDLAGIEKAIREAQKVTDRPSIISVKTTIGFGSSKQGTEKVHGSPLGEDDVKKVKTLFGFDPEKTFHIPDEVKEYYLKKKEEGKEIEAKWNKMFGEYSAKFPELASEIKRRFDGKLPDAWKSILPTYKPEDPPKGTRQFSQSVIAKISTKIPELVGGSADLNPSTLTYMDCSNDFQKGAHTGRNIRYGVREHGMAAISNGLHAYGGLIPFASTFFNFIGYALGAVRLSAVSEFGVIYIMTHDSIGLGEDGPTHQPVNSLMMMRAMPNFLVIRPADGNEVSGAYAVALEHRKKPSVIVLTRQNVPNLKGTSIEGVYKGAYTILDTDGKPNLILVGTGSEVSLAVETAKALNDLKVRVVSFPSWELFRQQSQEYKESVFPEGVPVLAIEAGSAVGWREFAHDVVGLDRFGLSGPYQQVYKELGFTVEAISAKAREMVDFYKKVLPHSLVKRPFKH